MRTTRAAAACATLAASCVAWGQATPTDPFDGAYNEGFERFPDASFFLERVLDDTADLSAGPSGRMAARRNWGIICALECCPLASFRGIRSAGATSQAARYDFDAPVARFGAYMGTNAFDDARPPAVAEFYDADLALIDTATIDLGGRCGAWAWNGWSFATPVSRIIIRGGVFSEAWVIMDDVRTDPAAPCRPDLDADGELTIFDFLLFQNLFDAGDLTADFDGDGELTIFDFLAFQNQFDAGCE